MSKIDSAEVIRLAQEAGMVTGPNLVTIDGARYRSLGAATNVKEMHLLAFAELVAAAERERCAKLCDRLNSEGDYIYGDECAAAIRANKD